MHCVFSSSVSSDGRTRVEYEEMRMVELTAPYVPGYLAFREADLLVELVERQKSVMPEVTPQVILIDGNGILHPHRFGLASHMGVLLDMPTVGVAKNLFQVHVNIRLSIMP